MIELPEAVTLARQLNQMVAGRKITSAVAGQSPHGFAFYQGDPALYSGAMGGRRIGQAQAQGGRVAIEAEDSFLIINDGVNLRYLAAGAPRPPKHQLLVELDDGAALVCTIQMYGAIILNRGGTGDGFYAAVAREAPSPLGDGFTRQHFQGIVSAAKPKLSAKGLLATEQRIPGLGNGCCHDIFLLSGINPQSHVGALSSADMDTLYGTLKSTLAQMTALGGRDTEKDLFGNPGGYQTLLSSKTLSLPCPKCGGEITRKAFLGGNIYFCPRCQPVRKV